MSETERRRADDARLDQILAAVATQVTISNEREAATAASLRDLTAEVRRIGDDVRPVMVDARGRAMFGARLFALLEKLTMQRAAAMAMLGVAVGVMVTLPLALLVLSLRDPAAVLAFVVALFSTVPG